LSGRATRKRTTVPAWAEPDTPARPAATFAN